MPKGTRGGAAAAGAGGGGRTDRGLDRRGRCRRGGAGPGGGRGLHHGPGGRRLVGLRRAVRPVPRTGPGGHGARAAAVGRGVPERLGGADDRRSVRLPARRDAPGAGRRAQRPVLRGAGCVPAGGERRRAGRAHPDGGRGGDNRRRGGRRGGAARGRGGRAAAPAPVAVRQPGGAARPDPGDRRAARRPAAGRLAELAADARRPRLQSARSGDARQRRRSEARVVARGPAGQPPDDAAGARRRDVPRQSGERRAGDRRGDRRRDLGVPRAAAGGRARGATRTLALYGDKLFLATADAALVALDARTGAEAWRTVKTDYTQGFRQNAGPVVADGVVVTGTNGCERYTEQTCFITGHDPDTGAELWRTSTIALPGDPNDASWGDTPPYLRAGRRRLDPGQLRPRARSVLHRHGAGRSRGWRPAAA